MSVLQIQTRKRSDDATEDLSDALKALADSGVRCYGTPGQDKSRHRSIIVDDKQALGCSVCPQGCRVSSSEIAGERLLLSARAFTNPAILEDVPV